MVTYIIEETRQDWERIRMAWFHEYTLRDGRKKSIKIEEWRTFRNEMKELGITERDIFQVQMVEKDIPTKNKRSR